MGVIKLKPHTKLHLNLELTLTAWIKIDHKWTKYIQGMYLIEKEIDDMTIELQGQSF